jgi:hypothetical protein
MFFGAVGIFFRGARNEIAARFAEVIGARDRLGHSVSAVAGHAIVFLLSSRHCGDASCER